MVAGHSYGEFVALAAAGRISEDDLLLLSEARGRFIREDAGEEPGAMAAIEAAPDALEGLLAEVDVVIANLNAPTADRRVGLRAPRSRPRSRGARERDVARAAAAGRLRVPLAVRRRRRSGGSPEMLRATQFAVAADPGLLEHDRAAQYPDDPAAIAEILGEHLIRPVEFVARGRCDVRRRRARSSSRSVPAAC